MRHSNGLGTARRALTLEEQSRWNAEGFFQAFMQEGAGEYGLG
jgi:hypothetical protein